MSINQPKIRPLEATPFRLAVVVASGGMKGDTAQMQTVMQARAMVVREYLVSSFRMDDTRIKTLGVAKSEDAASDAGNLQVVVYGLDSRNGPSKISRVSK